MELRSYYETIDLADCDNCPLGKKNLVYGHGCIDEPDIAFIAEAPGETEVDREIPLIGKSGSFLRTVIQDLGVDENRCYFTNMCLCRPPGNKKPPKAAQEACSKRLVAELADIKPKLIVTLGTTATKGFGQFKYPITKSYGTYQELELRSSKGTHTVGVIPTFHPSYVLRGGSKTKPEPFRDFADNLSHAKEVALDGVVPIKYPPYENYKHITEQDQFEQFLQELVEAPFAACDIESTTTDFFTGQILCIGFSWERETAHVVDWALLEQNLENLHKLDDVLKKVPLAFHNGLFDIPFMWHNGLPSAQYYLDTMQAHYLLDERQYTHGLERLAVKYYHAPQYKQEFRESIGIRGYKSNKLFSDAILEAPQEDLFDYNGADCDYTYRLAVDLVEQVKEEGQLDVLRDIEMPSCRMMTEVYMTGLLIDRDYLEEMGDEWGGELERTESEMQAIVLQAVEELDDDYYDEYGEKYTKMWRKEGINFNSPQQLSHFMFDVLGLYPFGGEDWRDADRIDEEVIAAAINTVDDPEAREYWKSNRTAISQSAEGMLKGISGRTTQAYMLWWLKQQHRFPDLLLDFRHANKRMTMYYDNIMDYMYDDGRIRPEYDTTATRTGRKSSRNPALHNLPRGDEVYDLVIPDPGWCLIHADYAQAEMRMMCHLSDDPQLLYVLENMDIHTVQVQDMYELTDEDIEAMDKTELSNKRIAAKMITYGLPYGRSAKGLAPQIGATVEEAKAYSQKFWDRYPIFAQWILDNRKKGADNNMAVSPFGRRRRFPLIPDRWARKEIMRQAGNFPIQSSINDLTLLAWFKSVHACRAAGIPTKPGMHIHDSLNLSVPIPFWVPAARIINGVMLDIPFESDVPFRGEVEVGDSWGNMITVVTKTSQWADLDPENESIPEYLHRSIPSSDTPV